MGPGPGTELALALLVKLLGHGAEAAHRVLIAVVKRILLARLAALLVPRWKMVGIVYRSPQSLQSEVESMRDTPLRRGRISNQYLGKAGGTQPLAGRDLRQRRVEAIQMEPLVTPIAQKHIRPVLRAQAYLAVVPGAIHLFSPVMQRMVRLAHQVPESRPVFFYLDSRKVRMTKNTDVLPLQ